MKREELLQLGLGLVVLALWSEPSAVWVDADGRMVSRMTTGAGAPATGA